MRRRRIDPRPDLAEIAQHCGFTYMSYDGQPYWREDAYYQFTVEEIDRIEVASEEVHRLCLELVDAVFHDDRLLRRVGLPSPLVDLARDSWSRREPSLYGRFDFSLAPDGTPKLLEFNADTPTSLYESAVFQWQWLEDQIARVALADSVDQFNSIHEKLVDRWKEMGIRRLHLAALDNAEDIGTISYLQETAVAANINTALPMTMRSIGCDGKRFLDSAHVPINALFKLYPWEWMAQDRYINERAALAATRFIEPPWKAVLSTKAILVLLYERNPDCPYLLPAQFTGEGPSFPRFARKPVYSREGANVLIVDGQDTLAASEGPYEGRMIDQELCLLPDFEGWHPVIGSWMVGEKSCGVGIRETAGLITGNASQFVPHIISDD